MKILKALLLLAVPSLCLAGGFNGTSNLLTSTQTWTGGNTFSSMTVTTLNGASVTMGTGGYTVLATSNTILGGSTFYADGTAVLGKPLGTASGGTGSFFYSGGVLRTSGGGFTSSELSGDATTSGSNAVTLAANQTHITSIPSALTLGAASNAVLVSSNAILSGSTFYANGQAVINGVNSSSWLTANQSITLTGAVTGSGATTIATTIPNGAGQTASSSAQLGINTNAGQLMMWDGTVPQVVASSTHSFTVTISSGIGWNSLSLPIWRAPIVSSVTITEILAESLPAATTVQYQLGISTFGSANVGTPANVFNMSFSSAADGGYTTTSFLNNIVKPKYSLILTTPASGAGAGTPSAMTLTVYYLENRQ